MWKQQLRRWARRRLTGMGLQRIRHPSIPKIVKRRGIEIVLDVGANDGHYARELRDGGYRGRIVSFEPQPDAYARLRTEAVSDPAWDVVQLALGDEPGQLPMSILAADVFSSLKKPNAYSSAHFAGAAVRDTVIVEVQRLDQFLEHHPHYRGRTYLKIDTQGFEQEVLIGCGAALDAMVAVQAELAVKPLYEGQQDWLTVIDWMKQRGFEVVLAEQNGIDWEALQLLELDIVFARAS